WWAGFVRPLYEWVQTTSFGYMARVTAAPRPSGASPLSVLGGGFMPYGALQLLFLVVLAAGVALHRWGRGVSGKPAESKTAASAGMLVTAAIGSLLPILALYCLSGTGDPRRAMVGITFLSAALTVTVLRAPKPLSRFITPLTVALAGLQLALL